MVNLDEVAKKISDNATSKLHAVTLARQVLSAYNQDFDTCLAALATECDSRTRLHSKLGHITTEFEQSIDCAKKLGFDVSDLTRAYDRAYEVLRENTVALLTKRADLEALEKVCPHEEKEDGRCVLCKNLA